jgi:hypothetical protein
MGKDKEKGGMRYRDLECFNMALLAKQGWRILQNPNSVVAKVYEEKYYKGGTFLTSNVGKKSSYAWRSIWNAKKLLEEGLVWRVGNGQSIKIWGDRWILSPSMYSIQSPPRILDREDKVGALIDRCLKVLIWIP